jgi:hypothetical protein
MAGLDLSSLANMGPQLGGAIFIIALVVLIAAVAMGLYFTGILTTRKYKITVLSPRANGAYKIVQAKGRFLKNGKFELFYGYNDIVKVNSPKQDFIFEGDALFGIAYSRDEINWIEDMTFDEATKTLIEKASVPEAAQLAYAMNYDEVYQRTHKANFWIQQLPYIAFLVAAIIVGLGVYIGNSAVSASNHEVAVSNSALLEKLLSNSTTVIYKTVPTSTTTTTGGFPNQPTNPNAPPG